MVLKRCVHGVDKNPMAVEVAKVALWLHTFRQLLLKSTAAPRSSAVATDDASGYRSTECWVARRCGQDEGIGRMAKETGSAAVRLSALIVEIEAEAYARGRADARREVLSALDAPGQSAPMTGSRREKPSSTGAARKRRTAGGKRAPRGSVRALVERALREQPGLTAREILGRAGTDAERLVNLGSIRADLQTGRRQGRYESKDRRWSLAASPPAEGDGASDAPASPAPDGAGALAEAFRSEADPSPETDEAANAPGVPKSGVSGGDVASGEPETGGGQNRLGMNW